MNFSFTASPHSASQIWVYSLKPNSFLGIISVYVYSLIQSMESSDEEDEEDDDGDYGTFVVKSSSKKGKKKEKEMDLSTMGRAVASMQKSNFGGKGRKLAPSSPSSQPQAEDNRKMQQQNSKMSTTSLPDSITREDPTTKYEFLNELGKGSYGSVYKARDPKTSEIVAVKVISLTKGEEGYEEIRGEIEMLQQCNHPNVVGYLGSYQGEDYLWIVMEYCGGGSVSDLMNVIEGPVGGVSDSIYLSGGFEGPCILAL